jgi:hypothetical protein
MDTHPTPFIFKLPNEFLRDIVLFLPGHFMFWLRTPDGTVMRTMQILVLMSISRRFRMIALEAEFWTSKHFDFDSLWRYTVDPSKAALAKTSRIKALVKNDEIASRLGQKTQWKFSSSYLLDCAILNIPDFVRNIREVDFYMDQDSLGQLSLCSRITKLTLSGKSVNLGQIHQSCPFLAEFAFHRWRSTYSGTINDISSLRSLNVEGSWVSYEAFPANLVPLRSASTLTHLKLTNFEKISPEARQLLSTFTNLTHLELTPLGNDSSDIIAELSSKLTTFICDCSYFDENPLPKIQRMFCSESMSRITTLRIHFTSAELDDEDVKINKHYSYSVLEMITSALPRLEKFDVEMYIEVHWCQMFAKWRNLKRLTLRPLRSESEEALWNPEKGMKYANELQDVFEGAFEGWEQKPLVTISL